LNIDFDDPNIDYLGLRKPAHEGLKASKRLQIGMGMLPMTTSISDELLVVSTSITMKDPELPKKGFKNFFFNFRLRRTL